MALTADEWHIVAICVFPLLSMSGITASIFVSASHNRTALSMGIVFSAGVLMSAALVHMLPHSVEAMEIYFAEEEVHVHNAHFTQDAAAYYGDDLHGVYANETEHADDEHDGDNHTEHGDHFRFMRGLEAEEEVEEEGHHEHAFPWAQTCFSIAFILLLCFEAAMERLIDVHFAGRKGNFFRGSVLGEEEEIMRDHGFTVAEHERLRKEQEERDATENGGERALGASRRSLDMPPLKEEDNEDKEEVDEKKEAKENKKVDQKEEKAEEERKGEKQETNCHSLAHDQCEVEAHDHSHAHSHVVEYVKEMGNERNTEDMTEIDEKEDSQPVAQPPGPGSNIKIPFPDCKDCIIAFDMPLSDCKDCGLLRKDDLGYEDHELFHRHHHHNTSHKKRGSTSQDGGSDKGLPADLRWRAPRRSSGASNVSGKSSLWGKSVGRPSVVSYGVSPPIDDPDQQQTINPWVAILLTAVLAIHECIESLTFGSLNDVDALKTTFIAIAAHKSFAGLALGSSLVASGYWESNRVMFFVLAGTWISVDIISQGIGMGIGQVYEEGNIVTAVLQSLTGGSFLFVATVELIPGEFEKMRKYNLPLVPILFSMCLGFALMTLIAKWA